MMSESELRAVRAMASTLRERIRLMRVAAADAADRGLPWAAQMYAHADLCQRELDAVAVPVETEAPLCSN